MTFYFQVEGVLAVQRIQVLQEHIMMLCLDGLLLAIAICLQTLTHFSWSFLNNHFGQMFTFGIVPRLLFLYFGVVFRSLKILLPYFLKYILYMSSLQVISFPSSSTLSQRKGKRKLHLLKNFVIVHVNMLFFLA